MKNSKKRGWVRLHRCIDEWPLYFSEPFTKGQAWIDLFMLANHSKTPKIVNVRGNLIEVKRGQLAWSAQSLSERWLWSRNRVSRFLTWLETKQQTKQQKSSVLSIITIVNYEKYQSDEATDEATDGQQTKQQTDTNKNDNNENNENKDSPNGGKTEFGNEQVNKMLEFLKNAVGVEDFTELRTQQRRWVWNIVVLMEKITQEKFARRLEVILADDFKRKNCNSLSYIYRQLKGFVEDGAGVQKHRIGYA